MNHSFRRLLSKIFPRNILLVVRYYLFNMKLFFKKKFNLKIHPLLRSKTVKKFNIAHMGSNYGGWYFVDEKELYNSTIISAGLGEDASFDIEFSSKYNAKVVIIDPTPRAIKHFNEIKSSLGQKNTKKYSYTGNQSINSYDLEKINKNNLVLIEKALWIKCDKIKFYAPQNTDFVSYSFYEKSDNYFFVKTETLMNICKKFNINNSNFYLLKMDIEGAEISIIKYLIKNKIFPKQILVEFEGLNKNRSQEIRKIVAIDKLLKNSNYSLIKIKGYSNFLYYLEK